MCLNIHVVLFKESDLGQKHLFSVGFIFFSSSSWNFHGTFFFFFFRLIWAKYSPNLLKLSQMIFWQHNTIDPSDLVLEAAEWSGSIKTTQRISLCPYESITWTLPFMPEATMILVGSFDHCATLPVLFLEWPGGLTRRWILQSPWTPLSFSNSTFNQLQAWVIWPVYIY